MQQKHKEYLSIVPWKNGDRCQRIWLTCSIDVILGGKEKGKGEINPLEMGYRVFYDVNRIGYVKSGDIYALWHFRQLQ